MEKESISILTELLQNENLRAKICAPGPAEEPHYMWPTVYSCPSVLEPTWKKMCLLLELIDENHLAEEIKQELEHKSGKTRT